MAHDNMSFFEVRNMAMKQEKASQQQNQTQTFKNFSELPPKKGISLVNIPAAHQATMRLELKPWNQLFNQNNMEFKARIYKMLELLLLSNNRDIFCERVQNLLNSFMDNTQNKDQAITQVT